MRRPEVTSFSERRIMTSCSSACDDVFEESPEDRASNGRPVGDTRTAACTVPNVTSFPASDGDVISRPGDKTPKRRHALASDVSIGSVAQHSPTKPLSCLRKSTSCCELTRAAAVPATDSANRMSSAMSTSTQQPAQRVQLGQKYAVACQQTESGTSFVLVDCGTGVSSARDVEKSRDLNANDEGKRSKLSQTTAWLSSGRSSEDVIIEDEVFVDRITDDVILKPSISTSSSSRGRERQMIFV